jgi:N-ethylmaleimide reductase
VHAAGGRIIAQLWHTGAIAHPDLRGGTHPRWASDVNLLQESVTPTGRKPTVKPRPMSVDEIRQTVADYARASRNAVEAGFDGVQILANYLNLLAQFLNRTTNRRTDEYGGGIENRARILFEVVEAVLGEVDPSLVGVKISPMHEGGPMAAHDGTLPMAEYAIRELGGYGLSHLLLMGNTTDFTGTPLDPLMGDGMFRHFRPIFRGTLIANIKTAERGNRLIAEGLADMVAFARPYIANPDLVEARDRCPARTDRLANRLRLGPARLFRLPDPPSYNGLILRKSLILPKSRRPK